MVESDPNLADPLLGAAMVLLATALEQMLNHWLKAIAHMEDPFEELESTSRPISLMRESLWSRIKYAPDLSPNLPFKLHPKCDYSDYLSDLVIRRNQLLHIKEEPVQFEFETDEEDESFESVTASMAQAIEDGAIDEIVLETPWQDVSITEARRSLQASKIYMAAVFNSDADAVNILSNPSKTDAD